MTSADLKILIADDHPIVRKGLAELLREGHATAVVGEADNGDEAIELALHDDWDVLILDITIAGANGMEVLKVVKRAKPALPVVMLSMHADAAHVRSALKWGASGYVSKEAAPDELLTAIRAVLAGETYLCRISSKQLSLGS